MMLQLQLCYQISSDNYQYDFAARYLWNPYGNQLDGNYGFQNFPSLLMRADLSEYLVNLTQKEEISELFHPLWCVNFGIQALYPGPACLICYDFSSLGNILHLLGSEAALQTLWTGNHQEKRFLAIDRRLFTQTKNTFLVIWSITGGLSRHKFRSQPLAPSR